MSATFRKTNIRFIRILGLSVLAVFAVSAFASASASARVNDVWTVANATLPKDVEVEPTDQDAWKLKWNQFETQCEKVKSEGAKLEAAGANSATGLKFEECVVNKPGPGKCEVEHGFIKTNAVTSQLEEEGNPVKHFVAFTPTGGGDFVEFKLKNKTLNGCGLAVGAHKVKGKATCETEPVAAGEEGHPGSETAAAHHELECNVTEASGELKVGSESASLTGSAYLKLVNGENWSP